MQKTSIVILTYNHLAYTKMCIETLRFYTKPPYEIIVVDNASSDGTVAWLKEQPDIITILNTENKGFAGGCNQGIVKSTGNVIVLLNNDTLLMPRWLDNLLACLNSSDQIGAAGLCSHFEVGMKIPFKPENMDKIFAYGEEFNRSNPKRWKEQTRLVGFCMAIKKSVIDKIGLLDEQFFPGNFEDDDYCLRMLLAGYKLMFCTDTIIYHHGSISFEKTLKKSMEENLARFVKKWGFNPIYHGNIRYDLIVLMSREDFFRPIRILEVGCGCGRTLLEVKNFVKGIEIFGIELNPHAARVAQTFANIKVGDVEKMELDYPEQYFDYIFFPDVLEHLVDPWAVLRKFKKFLKPNGYILASIPNVMHFTIIGQLLAGQWHYVDAGILDRTHLRFFTLATIKEMFYQSGYLSLEIRGPAPEDRKPHLLLDYLHQMVVPDIQRQLLVVQYLVKAQIKGDEGNSANIGNIGGKLF